MMNSVTRNRCSGVNSFVVCFYCNETFRSLSSLLKHFCSAEQKNALDCEPLDDFSDISSIDLDQEDSVVLTDSVAEKNSDSTQQRITESESNANIVDENSFSETGCVKALSNATGQGVTELATDASEERLSEPNSEVVRVVTKLVIDASEILLTETNSDVTEVIKLATEVSKEQSTASDTEQKITEVEPDADEECNRTSPDLVSKVLQYYEKQTNPCTPDNFCKSPSTEVEFQSPCSPLPIVESGSPSHNDTQIECSAADNNNASLTSERKCHMYGENITQNESDILKHNVRALEPQVSDIVSTFSPRIESTTKNNVKVLKSDTKNICSTLSLGVESDSSNMSNRSSSVEMDSLGCGYDQADSDDSETSNALLSEKESDRIKHNNVQAELPAADNFVKSFPEKDLNINHNSKILKSCYVKVQDIFKTLQNAKVSPQKLFSWKKKWHVCDICNKFFRLRGDLSIHYLSHSTAKPYMCKKCNKSFMRQSNLFTHQLAHTFKRNHVCSVCKISFTKRSLLLRHMLTHTKEKPYACDKCDKSYSMKSSLKEHYLTHSDARPFGCEICSQAFASKKYLRKHYYAHQKNEKLSCDLCFKTFKRKDHFKDHYNIHTNNRPHKCKICNKDFHLLLSLNNHYVVAHRNERPFKFSVSVETPADSKIKTNPVIQKQTVALSNKRPFKFPVSVETPADSKVKTNPVIQKQSHICKFCCKTFKRKNNLEEHYNIHTNDRPHKCKICNKAFHLLLTLNNHFSVAHKKETALKFPGSVKTSADCKIEKNPVIQKIQVTAEVHRSEKPRLVETPSIVHVKKDTFYYSTRRKSSNPRKYLQPNSDLC